MLIKKFNLISASSSHVFVETAAILAVYRHQQITDEASVHLLGPV